MISVVISAHNEAKNIRSCIESCQDLKGEIIVIDNESIDNTGEIAKKLGAKVYTQKNDPLKIDLQKNFGFAKATGDWVLSLDADERLTPRLIQEIRHVIEGPLPADGYLIPRKNIIFGKWIKHSLWWPDYQLRLFKKGKGKFLNATVHMPLSVKGEVKHLSEPMVHESYNSISQYVNRMNNIYTKVEAEKIIKEGKKLPVSAAVTLPASDFMKTFFLQKGYRDGLHGLVLSMLQSFYTFLVFAQVWEKQGFYEKSSSEVLKALESEKGITHKDEKYWLMRAFSDESRNPIKRILYKFSRKTLDM